MANYAYIVPTKNIEKFNSQSVLELLESHFDKLKFALNNPVLDIPIHDHINVYTSSDTLVMSIYFGNRCNLVDFDSDIDELNVDGIESGDRKRLFLSTELRKLRDMKPNLGSCILTTYGDMSTTSEKSEVEFFLKDIFGAYIFDEGIHPLYIHPSDKLDKTPFILKFAKWKYHDFKNRIKNIIHK